MEIGYCIAKEIPVVIAAKENVFSTYLPEMASYTFYWKKNSDLLQNLQIFDFNKVLK